MKSFTLRMDNQLDAAVGEAAKEQRLSKQQWIETVIRDALDGDQRGGQDPGVASKPRERARKATRTEAGKSVEGSPTGIRAIDYAAESEKTRKHLAKKGKDKPPHDPPDNCYECRMWKGRQ